MTVDNEDVKPLAEESSTTVPDVKEEVKDLEQAPSEPDQESLSKPAEEGKPSPTSINEALDSSGVPWKNRYSEMQRKFEDLTTKLPELIDGAVSKSLGKKAETKQPTKEELIRFRATNQENPEYVAWADIELEKIRTTEAEASFRRLRDEERSTYQAEQRRFQAHKQLSEEYPELFSFDKSGKIAGWNMENEFTQLVAREYNSDPDYAKRPDGELIAARMVYAQTARSKERSLSDKEKAARSQVSKEKRKNLPEGGGNVVEDALKSETDKAREELIRTGSRKSAERLLELQMEARSKAKKT